MQTFSLKHTYANKFFCTKRLWFKARKKTVVYNFTYPQSWNDLTPKQLLAVCRAVNYKNYKRYLEITNLMLLVEPNKLAHQLFKKGIFNAEHGIALLPMQEFLWQQANLTKNILPKIKGFYGPDDCLFNITADEFAFTYYYFRQYKKTKDEKWLHLLIAVLYRPAKTLLWFKQKQTSYNGDPRVAFNQNFTEKYAATIAKWPKNYKTAVEIFYASCEHYIATQNQILFNTSGSSGADNWADIIIAMAGPKFGNVNQTGATFLYTLLSYLKQQAIDAEKNKP